MIPHEQEFLELKNALPAISKPEAYEGVFLFWLSSRNATKENPVSNEEVERFQKWLDDFVLTAWLVHLVALGFIAVSIDESGEASAWLTEQGVKAGLTKAGEMLGEMLDD